MNKIFQIVLTIFIVGNCFAFNDNSELKHTVKQGETLYSISKQYNVSVDEIKANNPQLNGSNIGIGDVLVIQQNLKESKVVNGAKLNEPILHIVKKGETLYGIAKRTYGVEVYQVIEWNHLKNNELRIGQELIVGYSKENNPDPNLFIGNFTTDVTASALNDKTNMEVVYGPRDPSLPLIDPWKEENKNEAEEAAEKVVIIKESDEQNAIYSPTVSNTETEKIEETANVVVEEIKEIEFVKEETEEIAETVEVNSAKTDEIVEENTNEVEKITATEIEEKPILKVNPENIANAKTLREKFYAFGANGMNSTKERGAALSFDSSIDTKELFILHKTLAIGTIVKITNPVNDYSIYAKVAGPLPDTGENAKVILKMSEKGRSLLKALDRIFIVEVEHFN